MNKFMLVLVGATIFLFAACMDNGTDDLTLEFEETNCDNPWEAPLSQENYIVEVRKYLAVNGIEVISVGAEIYDENANLNCSACDCPSGRNIVIVVPVKDAKKAEELGFVLK